MKIRIQCSNETLIVFFFVSWLVDIVLTLLIHYFFVDPQIIKALAVFNLLLGLLLMFVLSFLVDLKTVKEKRYLYLFDLGFILAGLSFLLNIHTN